MTVLQAGPIPLSNFMPGRNDPVDGTPTKLDSIVLHTMVGWIGSADARFHNGSAQVSAHFGVRVDGSLWQWVQTWDTAYHAGLFYENLRSVGIEHEDAGDYNGPRSDALYARSAALVAQLCRENGIPCVRGTGGPGIYDHRDIIKVMGDGTATACPDALDTARIIREAAVILGQPITPIPPVYDVSVFSTTVSLVPVIQEWAELYVIECAKSGIRAEVALAHALHESGRFTFPGTAKPEWNNPAGLGVTGSPGVGNVFPTKLEGVIAHNQHILMYFKAAHTLYCTPPTIDQRHAPHRGYENDFTILGGTDPQGRIKWAPGLGYGAAVLALVPEAKAILAAL